MRGIIAAAMLGISVTGALAQTPAAPPGNGAVHLPDTNTPMASSTGTALRNRMGLWKCVTGTTITCYGVQTREQLGPRVEYTWSSEWWSRYKLSDNFHIEHAATQGYYVNGRGLRQAKVTLAQDDSVWYAVEFAGGADDITKAGVVMPNDRGNGKLLLTAPVGKTLD